MSTAARKAGPFRSSYMQTRQGSGSSAEPLRVSPSGGEKSGTALPVKDARVPHPTSTLLEQPLDDESTGCCDRASKLHEEERYAECVAYVSQCITNMTRRGDADEGKARERHVPRVRGAEVGSAVCATAVPPPFSVVSSLLHTALLSLLETKQVPAAEQLLQLWHDYKTAAVGVPEARVPAGNAEVRLTSSGNASEGGNSCNGGRTPLWCAVHRLDALLLAQVSGAAVRVEDLRGVLAAFAELVKEEREQTQRDERVQALRSLSANGLHMRMRETGRKSNVGEAGRGAKNPTAASAVLAAHSVRLMHIVLHHTGHLPGSACLLEEEHAQRIICWLRKQPQLALRSDSKPFSAWCTWRLCEARLTQRQHGQFADTMASLSEATREVQGHLARTSARAATSESLSGTAGVATGVAAVHRLTVSPLVAAIVRRHAASATAEKTAKAARHHICTDNTTEPARESLLRDAVQLALGSFTANVMECLRTGHVQLLSATQLHLDEFLIATALLDRETAAAATTRNTGVCGTTLSLFRVKATLKLIDALLLVVKEYGRFGLPAASRLAECGHDIIRECRRRLTDALLTSASSLPPPSSCPRPSQRRGASPWSSLFAFYISLTYEQEALLRHAERHERVDDTVIDLRAALAWWARSLEDSGAVAYREDEARADRDGAAVVSITRWVQAIEQVDEDTFTALYTCDTRRCVRMGIAYADCLRCGGHEGGKRRQGEAMLSLLLRLHQSQRQQSPRETSSLPPQKTKSAAAPSSRRPQPDDDDADTCMLTAALARFLVEDTATAAAQASRCLPHSVRRALAERLDKAEALCGCVVSLRPPWERGEDGNGKDACVSRLASSLANATEPLVHPSISCSLPLALSLATAGAASATTLFAMWEARALAHQVLADIATQRATVIALSAGLHDALSLSAVMRRRLVLVLRRRHLGGWHEDVAAAHVQLGWCLLRPVGKDKRKKPSDVAEALACAQAALDCLAHVVAQRLRGGEHGVARAERVREVVARLPLFTSASALRACCIQHTKW